MRDVDGESRGRLLFSEEQFWKMYALGLIPKPTELVDSQIILLPPRHYPESSFARRLACRVADLLPLPEAVGSYGTHVFPSGWLPMPDIAVYRELPPRRAEPGVGYPPPQLIAEAGPSTLDYDLGEKAERYAAEGVPEYWVADVEGRKLHVHREPSGRDWKVRLLYKPGDTVSPLCLPDATLSVDELLPDLYAGEQLDSSSAIFQIYATKAHGLSPWAFVFLLLV